MQGSTNETSNLAEEGAPGESDVPEGLNNVIQIDAGNYYSAALKSDGTVVAWGNNNLGETQVPADLTDVVEIACGGYHMLALKNDGSVVAWGANDNGQTGIPGGLSTVEKIAAGASALQLYTGLIYKSPAIVKEIKKELIDILKNKGFKNIKEAIGSDLN